MRSSRDIKPVVGMVVKWRDSEPETITGVTESRVLLSSGNVCINPDYPGSTSWNMGAYTILSTPSATPLAKPVVGMQYTFRGQRKKIHAIDNGMVIGLLENGNIERSIHVDLWEKYDRIVEWVPPTDEERKMFLDFARESESWAGDDFWFWYANESGEFGSYSDVLIAESLAMDGL